MNIITSCHSWLYSSDHIEYVKKKTVRFSPRPEREEAVGTFLVCHGFLGFFSVVLLSERQADLVHNSKNKS
jgi:hypothetical protein